jgi:hypothetical protein
MLTFICLSLVYSIPFAGMWITDENRLANLVSFSDSIVPEFRLLEECPGPRMSNIVIIRLELLGELSELSNSAVPAEAGTHAFLITDRVASLVFRLLEECPGPINLRFPF